MKQKNIMDITPFFDGKGKSCNDNIIISVAIWAGVDYRPMYADQWKFSFERKDNLAGIWKRGEMASALYYDDQFLASYYLNRYTKLSVCSLKNNNILDIYTNLLEDRPVAVAADTYYIPWLDNHYQKVHSEHAFLIVGCDENGVYCNDIRNSKLPVIHYYIDNDLFQKMYLDFCAVFQKEENKEVENDISQEIKKVNCGMFAKMEEFADAIKSKGIDASEVEPFDAGEGILLRAIRNIARSRYNYIAALECLNERTKDERISTITHLLGQSNENWELIKILIYKAFVEKQINKYNTKVVNLIEDSKNLEQKAYWVLSGL